MLERELKLNAPDRFRLPDLSVGGLEAVVAARRHLDAVYFDTPDLRLARWGCSLRHRTNEGWTVKLPPVEDRDLQQRREVAFEGRWDQIPPSAQAMVRGFARQEPLRPVARLRTVRKPVLLMDASGRTVGEVVDDDVSTYRGRGPAGRFREIEIEITDGTDEEILTALVSCLQQAGAGSVTRLSKLARALGVPATRDPDVVVKELGDDPATGEVIRAAFARSVRRFILHMPGVHLGEDPEALHQARVATRRLRSDLRTFAPLLAEQWATSLREDLRWLAAALGSVRDVDVLLLRLSDTSQRLPGADQYPFGVMLTALNADREIRRRSLLAAVEEERYLELLERVVGAANDPQLTAPAGRQSLVDLARVPFVRLRRTVRGLPKRPADPDLHRIRIRAKRVRYAADAVAPVVGSKATRMAKAAARLQDTLGELQDATVAYGWLQEAAREHPVAAFTAGELAGFELARAEVARSSWRKDWKRLSRPEIWSWM